MRIASPVRMGALVDRGSGNDVNRLGPPAAVTRNRLLVRVGPRAIEAAAGGGPRTLVRGICTGVLDHRCVSCGGLARSRHRRHAPNVTACLERQLGHVAEIAGHPDTGAVITGTDP
jgi:hypothetical protein